MQTLTLAPDSQGYGVSDNQLSWREVRLAGGLPRTRAETLNSDTLVTCQWTCDQEEFDYLRAFHSASAARGYPRFTTTLIIDNADGTEVQARFVAGTFKLMSQRGQSYVVGAMLTVDVVRPVAPAWPTDPFTSFLCTLDSQYASTVLLLHMDQLGDLDWTSVEYLSLGDDAAFTNLALTQSPEKTVTLLGDGTHNASEGCYENISTASAISGVYVSPFTVGTSTSFTIECSFLIPSSVSLATPRCIFNFGTTGTLRVGLYAESTNQIRLKGNGGVNSLGTTVFARDTWVRVRLTFQNTGTFPSWNSAWYVNDVSQASIGSGAHGVNYTNATLIFGADQAAASTANVFVGKIDNMRWTRTYRIETPVNPMQAHGLAKDWSPYAHNLSGSNSQLTPITLAAALFAQGFVFAGFNYLSVPYNADLNLRDKQFWIEGYHKPSTSSGTGVIIDFGGSGGASASWRIQRVGTTLAVYNATTSTTVMVTASSVATTAGFRYAVSRDGAGLVGLWVNGNMLTSATFNPPVTHATGIRIGVDSATLNPSTNQHDEIRISIANERSGTTYALAPTSFCPDEGFEETTAGLLVYPPSASSYSAGYRGGVIADGLGQGSELARHAFYNDAAEMRVQWEVDRVGYNYLRDVFRYLEAWGNPPFQIELILDGSELELCDAKLQPGTFRTTGVDGHRFSVAATLLATPAPDDVRPPYPEVDPLWPHVLLLLSGQGSVTDDDSSYARTLITSGVAPTLDSSYEVFEFPTYLTPAAVNGYLGITDDSFLPTICTNQEWCDEEWVKFNGTNGADGRYTSVSRWERKLTTAGVLHATVTNIGGSSYTISTASGAVALGSLYHVAVVRDKSDPTWDYIKLYVNGTLRATSSNISKSAVVGTGAGFGRILGYGNFGAYGNFSNRRFTGGAPGCARYYTDFTPPTDPFPHQ